MTSRIDLATKGLLLCQILLHCAEKLQPRNISEEREKPGKTIAKFQEQQSQFCQKAGFQVYGTPLGPHMNQDDHFRTFGSSEFLANIDFQARRQTSNNVASPNGYAGHQRRERLAQKSQFLWSCHLRKARIQVTKGGRALIR